MADGNPIIDLYRSMAKSSDPEVKNFALKINFNEFSNKITNDKDFREQIYYGLSKRGLTDLEPVRWEQSLGLYKGENPLQYMAGDSEMKDAESAKPLQEVTEEEEPKKDKGLISSALDYGKDIIHSVAVGWKRGELVQKLSENASAIDQALFDDAKNPNLIDFNAIAKINKEIEDYGSSDLEKKFFDPNTREGWDWAKMTIPTILGSFATLARSGYDEITTGIVGGGIGGAIAGGGVGPQALLTGVAGAGLGGQAGGAAAAAEMEYMLSIMDGLDKKKVNIKDPNALRKAWGNKNLMQEIRSDALKRTGIILAADIVGGIAGQAVTGYKAGAREALKALDKGYKATKFTKVKDKLVDIAIEGTAGMGGEATAILATKGKITAEDVPEIALEGLGEIPAIEVMFKPITSPIGDYINKKINPSAPAPAKAAPAEPVPTPATRGTNEIAVTQEEYDNFVNNNSISESRATAVAEDAQLVMQDAKHMEKLMTEDPFYAGMVEKFIEKGLDLKEVETITQVAYQETAKFYNMTPEELMNAVNQDHPAYNKEIADAFNNTFNSLFQKYKQATNTPDDTAATDEVVADQTAQPTGGGVVTTPGQTAPGAAAQGTTAQVGQVVQIDGKRYYVKDEGGGKLVVETEEGKIYEIPSDNPTIESIGATLLREAQPDKNYGIQVDNNNTATINGEKYVIIRDKQGNITAAKNQRRGNVSLNKPEVLAEISRQLADPNLRQLTTVSVQQPLTQVNETVQPEGTAGTTTAAQPQPTSTEMAGQAIPEGGQTEGLVQPGTEAAASPVGAPVSGVEAQNTYTRDSMKGISDGTGSQLEGNQQLEPDKVVQKLRVGDEVTFFAERERKGVWNGKAIIEVGTNNPYGIMGILSDPNAYIRNDTKIAEQSKPSTKGAPTLPSFEEYDSNFKGEGLKKGQRTQNKDNFSNTYGAEVYEGMRKINDNFTRITDALIKENRLDKKC
jgi:hypothetical protein